MSDGPITKAMTPYGLEVVVPELNVTQVRVDKEHVIVGFGPPPKAAPVSQSTDNAIERTLGRNADLAEELIDAYARQWRAIPDEALHDFLMLTDLPRGVPSFVQSYGPITAFNPTVDDVFAGARKREARFSFNAIRSEAQKLQFLLRVRDVIQDPTTDATERIEVTKDGERFGFYFKGDADRQLSIYLSWRLREKAKLGVGYDRGSFKPRFYCADVLTAIYALFLKSLIEGAPWAVCRRCGKPFKRSNTSKRSCSEACRLAWNQKRYRERQS